MNELKTWENLIEAFRLYREDIFTFVFFRCNRVKDLAEDITQETFEKAWVKRDLFKGGNLRNWLFQIASNSTKDSFKKNNKEISLDKDFEIVESENELYKFYVAKSLQQMKPREQELIILHYVLGYTYKEISEIYSVNENAIRVSVFRAFDKLKNIANGKIK